MRISERPVPAPLDRLRAGGLAALLCLAGCGSGNAPDQPAANLQAQQSAAGDRNAIVCAASGSDTFARACTVDRQQTDQGQVLTLRHPDGAFHRLTIATDGHGVVAADGAEPARVTITGANEIEVAVGGARYRLPATVRAPSR